MNHTATDCEAYSRWNDCRQPDMYHSYLLYDSDLCERRYLWFTTELLLLSAACRGAGVSVCLCWEYAERFVCLYTPLCPWQSFIEGPDGVSSWNIRGLYFHFCQFTNCSCNLTLHLVRTLYIVKILTGAFSFTYESALSSVQCTYF